ncbi:MAG: hypothetical protein PHI23_02640 [Candidatus Peribacteraceae bacterium]|nr:hypothetical protein [Candidatus Peribacteraceae bacterium]
MVRSAATNAGPESPPRVPTFERNADLRRYIGEETLTALGKAKNNTDRHRLLVEALRKEHPEMNGEAEKEARKILVNKQELERKEGWFSWIVKAPFRGLGWVWKKTFVEHPILTTLVLTVAGGTLAWYWLSKGAAGAAAARGAAAMKGFRDAAEAARAAEAGSALEGAGSALGGASNIPLEGAQGLESAGGAFLDPSRVIKPN